MTFNSFIKRHSFIFIFLLFVLYFAFIRKYFASVSVKGFDIALGVLLLFYFLIRGELSNIQLKSPQVIGEGDSFSIGGYQYLFHELGLDYYVFRRGGYESAILGIKQGDDGVLIVPKVMVQRVGKNFVYKTLKVKAKLDDLPLGARRFILDNNISEPYYLGLIPSESFYPNQELDAGSVEDDENFIDVASYGAILQAMLNSYNRVVSKLLAVLDDDYSVITKFNTRASNTSHGFNQQPKNLIDLEKVEKGLK